MLRLLRTRFLPLFTVFLLVAPVVGRVFGPSFFLFELFSHFSVQYTGLAGLLLAFWIGRGRPFMAFLAGAALLLNAYWCAPLFRYDPPRTGQTDLRVFHANVLYTRDDYQPIIDTIRRLQPDFFVLHEMTPTGVRAVAELQRDYPYQDSVWAKGPCYILVGSRTPFRTDSLARQQHRVIALTSTVRGRAVSLSTVHPRTPLLPGWFAHRNEQLQFVADQLANATNPAVLIGDFNISPLSPIYTHSFTNRSGVLGPLNACRDGFGWTPTWPRYLPFMFIPIDHAFVNGGFVTKRFRTLTIPGSDHRAICIDLSLSKKQK
ncbi:endonuclease/exonuclease/phosphatase family protein [Rudanella lutea]|uniref:endonuclease/exonuclease/phosphatase family protein n=1 Tax=Rudanella lutea TaxID=451374 RepID=UPI00037DFDFE|nr:endonuclease/exonuclease/phosphatase family protein [Rudanella lutea]